MNGLFELRGGDQNTFSRGLHLHLADFADYCKKSEETMKRFIL